MVKCFYSDILADVHISCYHTIWGSFANDKFDGLQNFTKVFERNFILLHNDLQQN